MSTLQKHKQSGDHNPQEFEFQVEEEPRTEKGSGLSAGKSDNGCQSTGCGERCQY